MTTTFVDKLAPSVAAEPSLHRVMGPWLLLLFIVGDILGTGIYALTGQVAKQVGGAVWLPFWLSCSAQVSTRCNQGPGEYGAAPRRSRILTCSGKTEALFSATGR
jgi:hypothetical protein